MPRNVAAGSKRGRARGSVHSGPNAPAPRRSTVDEFLAALADVPFFALAVRMAAVAVFIVIAALLSERAGPFFGAMVTSLPVYTGPVYLFLALDHPPEFLAQVTVGSLGSCAVIPIFVMVYALMVRAGRAALPSFLVRARRLDGHRRDRPTQRLVAHRGADFRAADLRRHNPDRAQFHTSRRINANRALVARPLLSRRAGDVRGRRRERHESIPARENHRRFCRSCQR